MGIQVKELKSKPRVLKSYLLWLMLFFNQFAMAAAFQIQEQSAAVLGTANAGTAVTRDPSSVFFNPAAMTQQIFPVISASGIWIEPNFSYTPLAATNFVGKPITGTVSNPGVGALVPGGYYIHPINDRWFAGIAVEVPFGLSTNYATDSIARYFATKSKITAYTFGPSAAYKINDKLSLGLGLNIQYLTAKLNQAYDFAAVSQFNSGDVFIENNANDWGVGWNVGLLFQPTKLSRLGIAYRSPISHKLTGTSQVSNVPQDFIATFIAQAFGLRESNLSASLQLPESLTFSFAYDITPIWTTLADIQYVHWSNLKSITLDFFGNPSHLNPATHHLPPTQLVLDYQDTVRVALGQEVKVNQHVVLRTGFAFDQTPSRGMAQIVRLPDGNRYWLTVGSGFRWARWAFDVAYAHIFIADRSVTQSFNTGLGGTTLFKANYSDSQADLGGVQLSYRFG